MARGGHVEDRGRPGRTLDDELTIIIAPIVLGDGKPLFAGWQRSLDLDQIGVRQSRFATFIDYRVKS